MSRLDPSVREAEAMQSPCPVCPAQVTQWCFGREGKFAVYIHVKRLPKR